METNAGLSVCCQLEEKKEINEPKDLQEHLQTGRNNSMAYDVLQRSSTQNLTSTSAFRNIG